MTQEEKQILIAALCEYLPYETKISYTTLSDNMPKVWDMIGLPAIGLVDIIVRGKCRFSAAPVEEIRPYLRPMKSMTEEEWKELYDLSEKCWGDALDAQIQEALESKDHKDSRILECIACAKTINFLNSHHLDYNGLIEKGLALEATPDMYN